MSGNGGVLLDGWKMVVWVGNINDDNTIAGVRQKTRNAPDDMHRAE